MKAFAVFVGLLVAVHAKSVGKGKRASFAKWKFVIPFQVERSFARMSVERIACKMCAI